MPRASDNSLFVIYLSPHPLKPKTCEGYNSNIVWDNLIFGGDIYQVKQKCHMQEGQLLLFFFFLVISPVLILNQILVHSITS